MSKVITFSQTFPSYHPQKGQRTYFVESFYRSLVLPKVIPKELQDTFSTQVYLYGLSKHHTIRKGKRFKKGDFFSPRVWGTDVNPKSGRSGAYHSKQIILAPDVEIKNVWNITISKDGEIRTNDNFTLKITEVARNDGLNRIDFEQWFNKLPFEGQIICWNNVVDYLPLSF